MIRIRPICAHDFDAYCEFSKRAHLGLTSLPKAKDRLQKRLDLALETFRHPHRGQGLYLFIAEDMEEKRAIGTASIDANPTREEEKFFFRQKTIFLPPLFGEKGRETSLLSMHKEKRCSSELGGLFLLPEFRQQGLGGFLSLSRFLFIGLFSKLFTSALTAELRGVSDEQGISPFWSEVGQHFCSLSYSEVLQELEKGRSFLSSLFPPYPFYSSLFSEEVRSVLGKPHDRTRPAQLFLQRQGFQMCREIDVLDAGPRLKSAVKSIPLIRQLRVSSVESVSPTVPDTAQFFLIGTVHFPFFCCLSQAQPSPSGNLVLPDKAAEALCLQKGDQVCYSVYTEVT